MTTFDRAAVGATVGRLRLLDELPSPPGRRARSFLSVELSTGRRVALTLRRATSRDEEAEERQLLEAVAAYRSLGAGPGALQDVDGGRDGTVTWTTAGWVEGGRLASVLLDEGYVWSPAELVSIGLDLCGLLERAERAGLDFGGFGVHDVVYVPRTGEVRLGALPRLGPAPKTPAEWARLLRDVSRQPPELLAGAAPSPAVDRYALCAVLFRLATRRLPYAPGPDLAAAVEAVLHDAEPSGADAAPGLRPLIELLARGLSRDPKRRPASAAALADELERCRAMLSDDPADGADVATAMALAATHYPLAVASPASQLAVTTEDSLEIRTIQSASAGLVTLLAAMALGELRTRGLEPAFDLTRLDRPSMGHWLQLLRRCHQRLSEAGEEARLGWQRLLREGVNARHSGDAALSALIAWRNNEDHGHVVDGESTVDAADEGRRLLGEALRHTLLLTRLSFVCVDRLTVREGRVRADGWRLHGPTLQPATWLLDQPVECGVVLVSDGDPSRGISLDPWVRCRPCPRCGQVDLFVRVAGEDGVGRYRSFHRGHRADFPDHLG